jgi:hypothetical protein
LISPASRGLKQSTRSRPRRSATKLRDTPPLRGSRAPKRDTRFFLTPTGNGSREQQLQRRHVQADTDRGCARTVASADLRGSDARPISSWVRLRRAIFCLRFQLNLDLSPLRADMQNSSDRLIRLLPSVQPVFVLGAFGLGSAN